MGNVLDIQFTFGEANLANSSHHAWAVQSSLQQLLWSTRPVAPEPQDLGWHTLSRRRSAHWDTSWASGGGPADLRRRKQLKSFPSPASDACAGGKRTLPRGWSQPPLSGGRLWEIEGLLCISHRTCFSPSPTGLCFPHPWFGQWEWRTPLQTKGRGDGEQLSPKVSPNHAMIFAAISIWKSLPWYQFIVTHVYTSVSSKPYTKTALDTLPSWKMLAGTRRP